MESTLQTLNISKILNPKPPYECKSIRNNPDLIALQEKEPTLFQDSYEEYIMRSGMAVYTKEIDVESFDLYENLEINTELEIISKKDWESLPIRSDGELDKFQKVLQQNVWESRKNGINHYHPWHKPIYHFDQSMQLIDIPKLMCRIPESDKS